MFTSGGGVGREITNRERCGPVLKFFASETFFFYTELDVVASAVEAIIAHTWVCRYSRRADLRNNATARPPALVNNYKLSLR